MSVNSASIAVLIVVLGVLLAGAAAYLRRIEMERPPVGRFNFPDVFIMCVTIVGLPLLYLHLPVAVVSTIFGLILLLVLQYTLAPLTGGRPALLLAVLLLLADAATSITGDGGTIAALYLTINDLVLVVAICGVCNLYVQSGLGAAHVALFAIVLTGYDYIATAVLPTTADLVAQLAGHPYAPQFVIQVGGGGVGLGLGDSFMLVLWTLAAAKGFGRRAGWVAAVVGLVAIAGIFAGFRIGVLSGLVPAMVVLGPLIVIQYGTWRTRTGAERTVHQWRTGASPAAETAAHSARRPVTDAVDWLIGDRTGAQPGTFVALVGGTVVGSGDTAGAARHAATALAPADHPVIAWTSPDDRASRRGTVTASRPGAERPSARTGSRWTRPS